MTMTGNEEKYAKSKELLKEAKKLIPSCTQTFSKGPTQFVQGGVSPAYLMKGKGCHVFDVDGNEFIDFPLALGPVTLGYSYPRTNEAIIRQLGNGITFSLMHPLEIELAKILVDIIPCAEMVRYAKNGSDATMGAIRASLAFTDREKIACCGYHGWNDWYISTTTRDKGIPKAFKNITHTFNYNDIESLEMLFENHKGEIGAVIMEPVSLIEPENNFLQKVKELAHKNGAVLIFDEIVTGFRIALAGAQERYGVVPDLACFGKGIANGMPLSVVVGNKEIMKIFDEIFFSGTNGGETLSLTAAIETIKEIREKDAISHFWKIGSLLQDGYNRLAEEKGLGKITRSIGLPPHTVFEFSDREGNESLLLKSIFLQETLKHGVLFSGTQNICLSHTEEDISKALYAVEKAFDVLKDALESGSLESYLNGESVKPVFRKKKY
ncbi:MAG: aminotransferase class III-fold pyridoxal phosphate-dependent enzyme [Nanohaloarchaea archaeon]|nr:aminotransferase class III-fold pyridoxal phosphate-dependent enzyme [Candidatus Nanohaloarchaea archaeon]